MVFISYSSKDFETAATIRRQLENIGIECWMAPESIPSGKSYMEEIPKAIRSSDIFLLILSQNTQESKWVPREVDQAVNNSVIILPFMIEDCILNDQFSFVLSNVQWIEAFRDPEKALSELIYRIRQEIGVSKEEIDEKLLELQAEKNLKMAKKVFDTVPQAEMERNYSPIESNFLLNTPKGEESPCQMRPGNRIWLGNIESEDGIEPVLFPTSYFVCNVVIAGAPGTGKTMLTSNLLYQAAQKGLHFVVFEPYWKAYRSLKNVVNNLQVFTPGDAGIRDFKINPLIPAEGISIERYAHILSRVLQMALEIPDMFSWLVEKTLLDLYEQNGWLDGSRRRLVFGLSSVAEELKNAIQKQGYSKIMVDELNNCILQLTMISEQYKSIFDTNKRPQINEILQIPTVFEMNGITHVSAKILFAYSVLLQLFYSQNLDSNGRGIKHLAVLDDVDELLFENNTCSSSSSELVRELIYHSRMYGFCFVMTCSFPGKIEHLMNYGNISTTIAFRQFPSESVFLSERFGTNKADDLSEIETGIAYIQSPGFSCNKMTTRFFPLDSISDEEIIEKNPT